MDQALTLHRSSLTPIHLRRAKREIGHLQDLNPDNGTLTIVKWMGIEPSKMIAAPDSALYMPLSIS